jgi:hypothetical protein
LSLSVFIFSSIFLDPAIRVSRFENYVAMLCRFPDRTGRKMGAYSPITGTGVKSFQSPKSRSERPNWITALVLPHWQLAARRLLAAVEKGAGLVVMARIVMVRGAEQWQGERVVSAALQTC